jgi:hypothetical protein
MGTHGSAFAQQVPHQFAGEGIKNLGFEAMRGTLYWSRSWSKETLSQGPLVQSPCGRFLLAITLLDHISQERHHGHRRLPTESTDCSSSLMEQAIRPSRILIK